MCAAAVAARGPLATRASSCYQHNDHVSRKYRAFVVVCGTSNGDSPASYVFCFFFRWYFSKDAIIFEFQTNKGWERISFCSRDTQNIPDSLTTLLPVVR